MKYTFDSLTDDQRRDVERIMNYEEISFEEALEIYERAEEMEYDYEAFEAALAEDLEEVEDFDEPDMSDPDKYVGLDIKSL